MGQKCIKVNTLRDLSFDNFFEKWVQHYINAVRLFMSWLAGKIETIEQSVFTCLSDYKVNIYIWSNMLLFYILCDQIDFTELSFNLFVNRKDVLESQMAGKSFT